MFPPAVSEDRIELWLPLKSFSWPYEVSNKGRVRTLNYNKTKETKVMSLGINRGGYPFIVLRRMGKTVAKTVHSLVMEVWHGNRPEGLVINHKDGVKTNNKNENLEYVTISRNTKHSFEIGTQCNKGINHSQAKMNDDTVRKIRLLKSTGLSNREVSEELGISRGMVSNVSCGRNWSHVI